MQNKGKVSVYLRETMQLLEEFVGDVEDSFLGEQLSVITNIPYLQESIYTLMNNRITNLTT